MQPYQEEYIANVKEYVSLTLRSGPEDRTLEEYAGRLSAQRARRQELGRRNMELLRTMLIPALDHLSGADEAERRSLQEFSVMLMQGGPGQVDAGLLCQVQEALVALARQEGDHSSLIEHLYWLGLARFALSSKLVNMPEVAALYYARVRSCFEEAAAYLEVFDQFDDDETRGYIIRSTANQALGQFPTVGERTRMLKESLQVMEHPYYRTMAPGLPWDQYIAQTHRLMVSSISHSKERAMTGRDVADIMRSVYIVYRGTQPSARQTFHCSAVEFYCGIRSLDYFLQQLERQMDAADSRDFSPEGMYSLISLPAFYCNYLSQYPERVGRRERFYIAGLQRRIRSYLNAFPPDKEGEDLFFFLRQFICTFMEVEQGTPFRDFLLWLILHFSPELYIHSRAVAEAAKVLSASLLDRDGGFFDGIPFLREISDPAKKREAVLDYAEGCGLFHDAGKINCLEIHTRVARRWVPMEYEMAHLHTTSGYKLLLARDSTSRYAPAALGHHAWYDGNAVLGYPAAYQRGQCPEREMVDVIALADCLVNSMDEYRLGPEPPCSFDEAVKRAVALGGRRFSPQVAGLLREEPVSAALRQALDGAADRACRELYQKSGK